MIKVIVVDDHDLVRNGIARLIDDVEDIVVVGEAICGEDALGLVKTLKPDVVLMDIRMPGIGGIEAIKRIKRMVKPPQVIALTADADSATSSLAFEVGALGYVTKGTQLAEMVNAIHTVMSGTTFICGEIAQTMARSTMESNQSPFEELSSREMQIAQMIVECQKVQTISDVLCLSPKTVNSYRYRLFEKLGVTSDVELTHLALKYRLIAATGAA